MKVVVSTESASLMAVMVASFLTPFMGSAVNLAIPAMGYDFGGDAYWLSWVVTAYLLSSVALLLPFGRWADIVDKKKIFVWGIILFAVTTALAAMAWSMTALIFFRVCQGIASSMIFSTNMAIVSLLYPPHKRGKAMGLTVATVYLGLSLGPVLGGVLNHYFGWRSIFYFTALFGLVAAVLALWKLKSLSPGAKNERFDWLGSVLYAMAITATLYGLSSAAKIVWAKYALILGLGLLGLFLYYESKQQYPILRVDIFRRNPAFVFSNLAAMINYSATFAVGFLISLFLQIVLGLDSQTAGLILLSQPLLMAIFSPFAGGLSDRVEPRIIASWGMGLCTVGLVLLTLLTTHTSLWYIIADLAVLGLGFALFASPNNSAIMGAVDKQYYGVAASVLAMVRQTGQTVSMAVVTLLLSLQGSNADLNREGAGMLITSSHTAFMVFALFCAVGVLASLARGNMKNSEKKAGRTNN